MVASILAAASVVLLLCFVSFNPEESLPPGRFNLPGGRAPLDGKLGSTHMGDAKESIQGLLPH